MRRANTAGIGQSSSLLCRRYLVVLLVDVPTSVNGVRERVVRWGIGALSSGELEFLGAWPGADSGADCSQAITDDLSIRGVEDIQFLAGSDPGCIDMAIRKSFPRVKVLPAATDFAREGEGGLAGFSAHFASTSAVAPQHCRIARLAVDAANQWALRLNRALARQGSFSSLAAATAFVRETIIRAERDYSALGPKTATVPVRAAGSSIKRAGIAALSS